MDTAAVNVFIENPTVNTLKSLKKPDLIEVAKKLEMEEIKQSTRKHVIARKIAEFYVDEDVFGVDDLVHFPDVSQPK